jgi:hypothetical protein
MLGALPETDQDPEHRKKALKHGHAVLDALVVNLRKAHIKELKKLPGPAK